MSDNVSVPCFYCGAPHILAHENDAISCQCGGKRTLYTGDLPDTRFTLLLLKSGAIHVWTIGQKDFRRLPMRGLGFTFEEIS